MPDTGLVCAQPGADLAGRKGAGRRRLVFGHDGVGISVQPRRGRQVQVHQPHGAQQGLWQVVLLVRLCSRRDTEWNREMLAACTMYSESGVYMMARQVPPQRTKHCLLDMICGRGHVSQMDHEPCVDVRRAHDRLSTSMNAALMAL